MSQDISRDTLVHALVGHTGVENQEATTVLEHIPILLYYCLQGVLNSELIPWNLLGFRQV